MFKCAVNLQVTLPTATWSQLWLVSPHIIFPSEHHGYFLFRFLVVALLCFDKAASLNTRSLLFPP